MNRQSAVTHLSNRDLLAVLVGENQADCLLMETEGSLADLFPPNPATVLIAQDAAMDRSWASPRYIMAVAREITLRSLVEDMSRHGESLSSSQRVRDYLRLTLRDRPYEVFMVLFLDHHHNLIAAEEMFRGTLTQTSVYPREVVKRALEHNASGTLICHNHPSGVAEASQADRWLTDQIKASLALVDVKLIDHFIVAGNNTVSFAERDWL